MAVRQDPTPRSKVLGWYFRFRGVGWLLSGFFLVWAWIGSEGTSGIQPLRIGAYFIILFIVPAMLLWTLGTVVIFRNRVGWWFGLVFEGVVIFGKTALGVGDLPARVWFWLSTRTLPEYSASVAAVGVIATLVYTLDLVVFTALLSPRGRDCYNIGKPNPDARPCEP